MLIRKFYRISIVFVAFISCLYGMGQVSIELTGETNVKPNVRYLYTITLTGHSNNCDIDYYWRKHKGTSNEAEEAFVTKENTLEIAWTYDGSLGATADTRLRPIGSTCPKDLSVSQRLLVKLDLSDCENEIDLSMDCTNGIMIASLLSGYSWADGFTGPTRIVTDNEEVEVINSTGPCAGITISHRIDQEDLLRTCATCGENWATTCIQF